MSNKTLNTIKKELTKFGVEYEETASQEVLQAILTAFEKKSEAIKLASAVKNTGEDLEKPIRVKVVCNNPAKNSYQGEFFGAGNRNGYIRAFVPYNCATAEDMFVPQGLLNVLRHRKFLHVRELSDRERKESGASIMHTTTYSPEFTIIELPMDNQ